MKKKLKIMFYIVGFIGCIDMMYQAAYRDEDKGPIRYFLTWVFGVKS